MENAVKAIIIAASTLIALMVLASMVYLFRQGIKLNEHYDSNQISRNLELYNSKFIKYEKEDNTIADIISVCNLAYDTNIDTDYDESWRVQIEICFNGSTSPKYKIPSTKPTNPKYKRNMIMAGSNPISIYDLNSKTLNDLGIKSGDNSRLGETFFEDDVQKFKYKFEFRSAETNSEGRIRKMVFNCDV